MSTSFFQRQEKARSNTVWLIAMFVVAVLAIVGTTVGLTVAVMSANASGARMPSDNLLNGEKHIPWELPTLVGVVTLAIILLGSLYKVLVLRAGGGSGVAESLGGTRIFPDTRVPEERRLLNVVEEMAIAAGTPVPPVFLLGNESGINAFAAGYSPKDAVIGVTRGAVEKLSRDELQGVIAHEFSHIFNGDMRLGIRLIGVLHGILLLGLIGRVLVRVLRHAGNSRSKNKNGGGFILAIFAVGVALVVLGAIGGLVGNLIKAAVSRQREFLADASAIQFTRNPGGLGNALKHIGALISGSQLQHPSAAEASHLYFAQGVSGGFASWFATHPPIAARIRAIDPTWNGLFDVVTAAEVAAAHVTAAQGKGNPGSRGFAGQQDIGSGQVSGFAEQIDQPQGAYSVPQMQEALSQVGEPSLDHQHYARMLTAALPVNLSTLAREPYAARGIVLGLLLDTDQEIADKQLAVLQGRMEPHLIEWIAQNAPQLQQLDARLRLPLIDIAIPALCAMTEPQYRVFEYCFNQFVAADNQMAMFEWVLAQIIMRHLRSQFYRTQSPVTRYYALRNLRGELAQLLSSLAHVGHAEQQSRQAFVIATKKLPEIHLEWLPPAECSLPKLNQALTLLTTISPGLKERVLSACSDCVCADGIVRPTEAELLRGIADLIDCPVPPLLPGQRTAELIR